MAITSTIIITYSAKKRLILFAFSGVMLLAGLVIFVNPFRDKLFTNQIVEIFGIIFLISSMVIVIFALLIKKTAILIGDDGIVDNSGSGYIGYIPWQDVVEVKKKKMGGERFICVFLSNPDEYVKKTTSSERNKRMNFNITYFDTPIAISSKGLEMDYYSLLEMFQRKHNLFIAESSSVGL
jgi:hypothetical protein